MPRMAEASIQWKVDTLRAIMAAPIHSRFAPMPDTDEMAWFIDMKKDGYVEGKWGREVNMDDWKSSVANNQLPIIPTGGKEVFSELHVTEKGKKFVRDYDSQQQATGDLKNFKAQELLKWDDKTLAEWQSHYKSDQPQWILADHEWRRRAGISTRRIAITAIAVSILSFAIAAIGYFFPKTTPASYQEKIPDQTATQSKLPTQLQKVDGQTSYQPSQVKLPSLSVPPATN